MYKSYCEMNVPYCEFNVHPLLLLDGAAGQGCLGLLHGNSIM